MASPGRLFIVGLLVAVCAVGWTLEADDHTLFLCRFDGSAVADFAVGSPHPEGVVGLTEGRHGKALSAPLGLLPYEQSVAPITTGIMYDTAGNFDLQQGTIELWVRSYSGVTEVTEQSPKLRYLVSSGKYTTANHGFALLLSRFEQPDGGGYVLMWTRGNGSKEKSWGVNGKVDWKPGEWHHVAVTYSPSEDALYADGKLVGKVKTGEGMDIIGEQVALGANHYHGHVCDCALDEVRFSDTVRYTGDFTVQ